MRREDIKVAPEVTDDQFISDLLLLEDVIDAMGWDQPARLYAVLPDGESYRVDFVSEVGGHPVDWMRGAVLGARLHFPDSVKGVALAVEGWRNPTVSDLRKKRPEIWEQIEQAAALTGITDENEIVRRADDVFYRMMEHIPPSQNPLRVEVRTVMVLMRDGKAVNINRDRDGEAQASEVGMAGRVIQALQAMLTGVWPADPDMNTPTPDRS